MCDSQFWINEWINVCWIMWILKTHKTEQVAWWKASLNWAREIEIMYVKNFNLHGERRKSRLPIPGSPVKMMTLVSNLKPNWFTSTPIWYMCDPQFRKAHGNSEFTDLPFSEHALILWVYADGLSGHVTWSTHFGFLNFLLDFFITLTTHFLLIYVWFSILD